MYTENDRLPIGALLQSAGLVSARQVNTALNTQSKYSKMRLGEILVLQTGIKAKTVNFFVGKWQEVKSRGKQFPLGYYFKKAALLNENQIKIILAEQKKNKLKFGKLAVDKGWLSQETIDFFLDNLPATPPEPVSLSLLERYSDKILHLENQAANPTAVLQEITYWTGGHPILTKILCQILANSDLAIPIGLEKTAVRNLVNNSLIEEWEVKNTAEYLRNLANSILNNQRCQPTALLKEYRRLVLQREIAATDSKEQQELLIIGVAIAERDKLKVANPIFQNVFNLNWIEEQLINIKQAARTNNSNNNPNFPLTQIQPITKLGSLITLLGIALLAPLIIILNNYNSKFNPQDSSPVNEQISEQTSEQTSQSSISPELEKLCQNQPAIEANFQLGLIGQLEQEQQRLQADFPPECENTLHKLWVLAAPQLGKEGRVIEALNYLCKVPPTSASFNQAKLWIDNWYNSPNWGQKTKSYINLINNCPAAAKQNKIDQGGEDEF